ncbi:hypothetical protein, partial [Salmonella enterica]|uniref:hypothetical protein n=1 Tax=Salmonella enterica TaxID=28901 RepID=UPI003526B98A
VSSFIHLKNDEVVKGNEKNNNPVKTLMEGIAATPAQNQVSCKSPEDLRRLNFDDLRSYCQKHHPSVYDIFFNSSDSKYWQNRARKFSNSELISAMKGEPVKPSTPAMSEPAFTPNHVGSEITDPKSQEISIHHP